MFMCRRSRLKLLGSLGYGMPKCQMSTRTRKDAAGILVPATRKQTSVGWKCGSPKDVEHDVFFPDLLHPSGTQKTDLP